MMALKILIFFNILPIYQHQFIPKAEIMTGIFFRQ